MTSITVHGVSVIRESRSDFPSSQCPFISHQFDFLDDAGNLLATICAFTNGVECAIREGSQREVAVP